MSANKKFYIAILIFGILSVLLIVFLISPFLKEIKKRSEELLLEKKKIIFLTKEKENLENIKNLYDFYQLDIEKLEEIFIEPEIPIGFISFLESTASSSYVQLKISSMTKKLEKKDPWPSLSFQLLLIGSSPNFLKFLEKLENSPYLIEVLDLNIRKITEKEIKPEEFKKIPSADASAILSIKVFTK